jgi:two-component system response regulator DegU
MCNIGLILFDKYFISEDVKESFLRVLLVDDNENFLESLIRYMRIFPSVNIVGKASNGEAALELCSKLTPDLVMMDIRMPGMSGFEAARTMKTLNNPPRILLLSFNDNPEYIIETINSGADGYIAKSEINSGLFRQISSIFSLSSGTAS